MLLRYIIRSNAKNKKKIQLQVVGSAQMNNIQIQLYLLFFNFSIILKQLQMSIRLQPYRSRMPTHILQLISVASRITLYLLGETGPTSFIFKDRLNNKHKVSIGDQIKCTCQLNKNDHCIHSIYVLIRIFNINPENPLLWQSSYLDSQISDILSGKFSQNNRRPRPFNILESSYFNQQQSRNKFNDQNIIKSQRMILQTDTLCPICQEQMNEQMLLTYCKVKCGNNFHLNCLKIWIQHKVSTETTITCPMCRCQLQSKILDELNKEQYEYKKKQKKKKFAKLALKFGCKGCGLQQIPNHIYKCLFCSDFCLCVGCFHNNKHIKHPFILNEDGQWRGASQRRENQKKILDFINKKRKQNYGEQIINRIAKINEEPAKIFDFMANAYPYVSKYISENIDPYKKMDFQPEDLKCMSCSSTKMIYLRRLNCGHFIDHNCLKQYITLGKFHCNIDGTKFLKGYQSLIQMQQEIKRKENDQYIQTPIGLHEKNAREQNYRNNIFQQEKQQTLADLIGNIRDLRVPNVIQKMKNKFNSNIVHQNIDHISRQQTNIRIRNLRSKNKNKSTGNRQVSQKKQKISIVMPRIDRNMEELIGRRLNIN